MILWYYQIRPKVVWKVYGAWIDGYDLSEQRQKHYHSEKYKSDIFLAVYHSKKHVIPHRVIGAILDVILNFLQR